jgi:hypothetical protein
MELERPPKSALIKRLRDASRVKPRSLGFGRRDDEKPSAAMVLVAQVGGFDAETAAAAAKAGAAAVAFAITADELRALENGDLDRVRAAVKACGDAVAGMVFEDSAAVPVDLSRHIEALEIDFAIASVERAPAALIGHESTALVARIEGYGERPAFLRALGELKVDAVVAGRVLGSDGQSGLRLFDLMGYKLVVESVRQPVLIVADEAALPADLQALRDVGVDGLILPVARDAASTIAPYVEAIGKLKITSRAAPSSDGGPMLPRMSASAAPAGDEDDEDDD